MKGARRELTSELLARPSTTGQALSLSSSSIVPQNVVPDFGEQRLHLGRQSRLEQVCHFVLGRNVGFLPFFSFVEETLVGLCALHLSSLLCLCKVILGTLPGERDNVSSGVIPDSPT